MRRHLGLSLTCAAVTYLALGCQVVGGESAGAGGGATTGSGGEFGGSNSGSSGTSSGAGGATTAGADTSAGGFADPKNASCVLDGQPPPPVYLSVARARSTVSATQLRGILTGSTEPTIPLPSLVHGPELLSYFHIDYPVPNPGSLGAPLAIVTELVPTAVSGQLVLQIGVQAPKPTVHRDHTVLTVLVDTSKSMEGEAMKRANAAVLAMASSLATGDVLNLVTTNEGAMPVHRVAASDGDPALFQLDPPLTIGGLGDLEAGLELAYKTALATDSYVAAAINRVVVITDGGGLATPNEIELASSHWTGDGIQLVGVGVGSAVGYRRELLDAVTIAGHGANLYLDSVTEADVALHQRFDEIMDEAAGDLTVAFQLPAMFDVVNANDAGADLTPGDLVTSDLGRGRSMVFRHAVTACPGLDTMGLDKLMIDVTASWTQRGMAGRQTTTATISVLDAMKDPSSYAVLKTSAVQAYASALASLQVTRFQDACTKLGLARARLQMQPNITMDHDLDAILAQIKAHPVMANQSCP
jgi:hypothetical protein